MTTAGRAQDRIRELEKDRKQANATTLKINAALARMSTRSMKRWQGARTWQSYEVQWVAQLGSVWQTIATVASAGLATSFTDTNVARLAQPAGFYRILRQ